MPVLYNSKWEIKDVKCVLFDKDGTLLDGNLFWGNIIVKRSNHIIQHYDLTDNSFRELCLIMGYSIETCKLLPAGPVGVAPREKVIEVVVDYLNSIKINVSFSEIGSIFNEIHTQLPIDKNSYVKILPGVKKLFNILKKYDIKISIVTSDTELNTLNFLKENEILNYVDLIIGRETTVEHKNTGIPAIIAIEKLNIKSDNIVCIGDAPMDLIMSKNSNCLASIGVLTGQTCEKDLKLYTQFIVENLEELNIKN